MQLKSVIAIFLLSIPCFSNTMERKIVRDHAWKMKNDPEYRIKTYTGKLLEISATNNTKKALEYLQNGANVNAQNDQGYTSLMHAVQTGNVEMVRLFLEHKANPNLLNINKRNALMICLFKFDLPIEKSRTIIKLLIDAGTNLKQCDVQGITADKILAANCEANRYLKSYSCFKSSLLQKTLKTIVAHLPEHADSYEKIIAHHFFINEEIAQEILYLSLFSMNWKLEQKEKLINTMFNTTPAHMAKTIKPILTGIKQLITLAKKAEKGNRKYNLDQVNGYIEIETNNRLPLIVLAAMHHPLLAQFLLTLGANPNDQTSMGVTPLIAAARKNDLLLARQLIDKDARIDNLLRNTNCTALICAAERGHTQMVELLLNAGANVYQAGRLNETALSLAEDNKHKETADLIKQWIEKYPKDNGNENQN